MTQTNSENGMAISCTNEKLRLGKEKSNSGNEVGNKIEEINRKSGKFGRNKLFRKLSREIKRDYQEIKWKRKGDDQKLSGK